MELGNISRMKEKLTEPHTANNSRKTRPKMSFGFGSVEVVRDLVGKVLIDTMANERRGRRWSQARGDDGLV